MLGKTNIPLLEQAEHGIQSKLPAAMQPQLAKVVSAGLSIMYAPQLRETLIHRVQSGKNPPQDAGAGAARMMGELMKQSGGKLPPQLMMPAAMIFAFEYLDLVNKINKVDITPQIVAHTVQAVTASMFQMSGITPQKFHQLMAQQQAAGKPAGIIGSTMQGA